MLADPFLFMAECFPGAFSQEFTPNRREMVSAIIRAAREGGDQAIAGPRADGKTTCAMYALSLIHI